MQNILITRSAYLDLLHLLNEGGKTKLTFLIEFLFHLIYRKQQIFTNWNLWILLDDRQLIIKIKLKKATEH